MFCGVGDLLEGKMRKKVFAFWLGQNDGGEGGSGKPCIDSGNSGKWSIEDSSHLLPIEGLSEQIVGCDIIRGFGRPGQDEDDGEGEEHDIHRRRFVVMACTASGTLKRWSIHLDQMQGGQLQVREWYASYLVLSVLPDLLVWA